MEEVDQSMQVLMEDVRQQIEYRDVGTSTNVIPQQDVGTSTNVFREQELKI